MKVTSLHPAFLLNGTSFTSEGLKEQAYDFIKEGADYEARMGEFLLDWLSPTPTVTVQTSGSTGKPKQLVLKKHQMVNSAFATGGFFGLQAGNTALHCLPTDFIAGKMMLVRAMVLGLELTSVPPVSNPLETLSKSFDFAAMVPLQLRNSIHKIDGIKTLIIGGAALSKDLKELAQNKPTKIYETYGMTETITHIALKQINHISANKNGIQADSFITLPNVALSQDVRDCLIINAPNITDIEVVTNDVVKLISKTEFQWLGRYDTIINSGGIKLIPEQIEGLFSHIIPHRFFVAGLPDDVLGQKLVLIVEGQLDKKITLETLQKSGALDKFQIPKDIITIANFIDTKNGKINRAATLECAFG